MVQFSARGYISVHVILYRDWENIFLNFLFIIFCAQQTAPLIGLFEVADQGKFWLQKQNAECSRTWFNLENILSVH